MTDQLSPLARFENIVLSTDGTDVSAGAVRVALRLGKQCGSRLTVMHMARTYPGYAMFNPTAVGEEEKRAQEVLDKVEQQAGTDCVNCVPVMRYGEEPVHEISSQVEDSNADLLIMGRRGVHWLERLVLGEAAARVIGHVRCSVLAVPKGAGMWQKGILLAVDGSRHADVAALSASALAKCGGLPVTVVTVCASDDLSCDIIKPIADRVRDLLVADGVSARSVVLEGRPADQIVQAARDNDCDLIVVGCQGRSGLDRLLMGSVSQQVVVQAACPVLVVKEG